MGASGWDYYVAYQPDLQAALDDLRQYVFETGDDWWAVPCECGTRSILDMFRVVVDGEEPVCGTVQPVTEMEALEQAGVTTLTRAHVEALGPLAEQRWLGRCAVLCDDAGNPKEIYFWGFSGDERTPRHRADPSAWSGSRQVGPQWMVPGTCRRFRVGEARSRPPCPDGGTVKSRSGRRTANAIIDDPAALTAARTTVGAGEKSLGQVH